MSRVGFGYDVHRFADGRKLMLGGVEVPYRQGLEGHSDADVLLHAVCDALLGALGQGDIGEHFPNTDERYKGISSMKLLEKVAVLVKEQGCKVENIDSMIVAEEPSLKKYKGKMAENIAKVLSIEASAVNVKAGTNEGMGFLGEGQGIAAYAVVLLS